MSDYTLAEVRAAARFINWAEVASKGESAQVALVLRDKPVVLDIVDIKAGSYYDGYENNAQDNHIIFRLPSEHIGEQQLFKQKGWADSYGESEWDGELIEVVAKTQSTTVYEPKR